MTHRTTSQRSTSELRPAPIYIYHEIDLANSQQINKYRSKLMNK